MATDKTPKNAVSLEDSGISTQYDFVGSDILNPDEVLLENAIPFYLMNAEKMTVKKDGDDTEVVAFDVQFEEAGDTVRRLFTLKSNAPRLKFVERFAKDKRPIGPVLLWKKIVDPKKGPVKKNEVWMFVQPDFAKSAEYRKAVEALTAAGWTQDDEGEWKFSKKE